ncbi:MAG TPA: hypothetical protein VGM88_22800 [Kofleriaceae bacterium]|jgi:hypothetical protein
MLELPRDGHVELCRGTVKLLAEWTPGDVAAGSLHLTLEDQRTFDATECKIRLDPGTADSFPLLVDLHDRYVVICGYPAIVSVSLSPLALRSSVSLDYKEASTLEHPWWIPVTSAKTSLVATDRKIWALDENGQLLWLWSCDVEDRRQWIARAPTVRDGVVQVELGRLEYHYALELSLRDGQPVGRASRIR